MKGKLVKKGISV